MTKGTAHMPKKKDGPKIEIVLASEELIAFCHDEIAALTSKMGEFNQQKKKTA